VASLSEDRVLSCDDVTAAYPGAPHPSLTDVSLHASPGEIVAMLGANGAGKSTLLRVAAGLLAPRRGRVRVCGRDVGGMARRDVARIVGLVPQSEAVAAGFSVRQVVAMGRAPHQQGWMRERPQDREAIDEALARCDLSALAGRAVETLSGGELRRVAIARAVAARPRLLLLDEPGAFLDVRHALELCALLGDIAGQGIACLVAMHDLDAAARLAGRVVLLRAGRVIASGPPAEVLTPARLREALRAEVDVGVHAATGARYFVPLRPSE
jgi:iron complex transport system ATP-binding protein